MSDAERRRRADEGDSRQINTLRTEEAIRLRDSERTCWNCGVENMECQPRAGTWHDETRLLQLKELKRRPR